MQEHARHIIVLTRSAWQTPAPAERHGTPQPARRTSQGPGLPFEARRPAERRLCQEACQPA